MTTLTTPTLQRRLLLTVGEAVAKDRLEETIRLGVGVVREIRKSFDRGRQEFEDILARGVEARSFASSHGPLLPITDEYLVQLGRLLEELSGAEETPAESFVAELRLHEKETIDFRDRLAKALSLATQPPGPVDWDRLRAESDADFASGRFTSFETPEDLVKGLAGSD
jgi:hypothetical protein